MSEFAISIGRNSAEDIPYYLPNALELRKEISEGVHLHFYHQYYLLFTAAHFDNLIMTPVSLPC